MIFYLFIIFVQLKMEKLLLDYIYIYIYAHIHLILLSLILLNIYIFISFNAIVHNKRYLEKFSVYGDILINIRKKNVNIW